jgi:hypothetical protein
MDKKIAGLLAAASSVALIGSAQAVPAPQPQNSIPSAQSYAELLDPIPNAVERLKADDAALLARAPAGRVKLAEDEHHHHHHHHHHDHGVVIVHPRERAHHHHHHHHHHHNGAFIGVPGVGGVVIHGDRD